MLLNAYFLTKFRFDTAENEPAKNLQNLITFANFADPNPVSSPPMPHLGTDEHSLEMMSLLGVSIQ